jgi:hypothetical protein
MGLNLYVVLGSAVVGLLAPRAGARAGGDGGGRADQLSDSSAYFCTSEPTFGSAAATCLTALPRIAP